MFAIKETGNEKMAQPAEFALWLDVDQPGFDEGCGTIRGMEVNDQLLALFDVAAGLLDKGIPGRQVRKIDQQIPDPFWRCIDFDFSVKFSHKQISSLDTPIFTGLGFVAPPY